MVQFINIIKWVFYLGIILLCIIFYEVAATRKNEINELNAYYKQKEVADSILLRRIQRDKEDLEFAYRDSLRQMRINYILLQNEKSRKKTVNDIRILKSNPSTQFKDSIWANGWKPEEPLPF